MPTSPRTIGIMTTSNNHSVDSNQSTLAGAKLVKVALPVPIYPAYDYVLPNDLAVPPSGARVLVPFGQRQLTGVCLGASDSEPAAGIQYKAIMSVLDDTCVWPEAIWNLVQWAADYYQHPLGDALMHALPVLLRHGEADNYQTTRQYELTTDGAALQPDDLKRAPQQQRLLAALKQKPLLSRDIRAGEYAPSALRALQDKGWVRQQEVTAKPTLDWQLNLGEQPLQLNQEQAIAVATIAAAQQPQPYLLQGVTGSGKTEVYLQCMTEVLRKGGQVLVLVPEIGLTPQTLQRFQQRFSVPVVMLHSGLTDRERLDAWLDARCGAAAIVIGTRSAIFTPFAKLGLIILDEEHDNSYKQQDGFRYNARDLAVKRGHHEAVPVLLGTATPSLETLANAKAGRYGWLTLENRAGGAKAVRHQVLDIKQLPLKAGLSEPLLKLMGKELEQGNQVLLFLNRRGFAAALICHECGWLAQCPRCDAYFTVHQSLGQLQCHHCGTQQRIPRQCNDCGSTQLMGRGVGTEQLEQVLQQEFPDHSVLRIDRDSTRRKGELAKHLQAATENKHSLLVGTQMLAKGHHFPDVTLVALLDVDGALYSSDFRSAERLGQLYTQVAGRAGRASKQGTVVLQTHHPEHELIQDLVNNGYHDFALTTLTEREQTQLPPFSHMTLFRAEATEREAAVAALEAIGALFPEHPDLMVLGPLPAVMERKAGKFRYQLIVQCAQRGLRQQVLKHVVPQIAGLSITRKVRWSLDVDPQDFT